MTPQLLNKEVPNGLLDPTDQEAVDIQGLTALTRDMLKIGAQRLLYGENPLLDLMGQASARGAVSPAAARETLTRQALRRKADRQKAFRAGLGGLRAAIAAG